MSLNSNAWYLEAIEKSKAQKAAAAKLRREATIAWKAAMKESDLFPDHSTLEKRYGMRGVGQIAFETNSQYFAGHDFKLSIDIGAGPDKKWWSRWRFEREAQCGAGTYSYGTPEDQPLGPFDTREKAVIPALTEVLLRAKRHARGIPKDVAKWLRSVEMPEIDEAVAEMLERAEEATAPADKRDDENSPFYSGYDESHPVAIALRAAGLNDGHLSWNNTMCNRAEKSQSRLLSFPLHVFWWNGNPVLGLCHPALADLPFVREVEDVTGLKAEWRDAFDNGRFFGMGTSGEWHHAVDLCSDMDWQELLATRHLTTDDLIRDAVETRLESVKKKLCKKGTAGYLSPETAAKILAAIDSPEKKAA